MSIEAYQAAWLVDCSGSVKLTLLAIAEFASSQNGYTCCASVNTLSKMVGTQERQIIRNLRILADGGWITIQEQRGRGNTNIYSMSHLIKPVTDDTFYDAENLSSRAQNLSRMTGFNRKNLSSRARKGVMDDTQTIYNHIKQKNGGMNGNGQYIAPLAEPITKIITALTKISATAYHSKTEQDYEEAAFLIAGWDCDESDVAAFEPYWEKKGYYKGRPKLKSIMDEFRNFLDDRSGKAQKAQYVIPDHLKDIIRR